MKVLSCNVWGLGSMPKQKVVRELVRQQRCVILLLQETKLEFATEAFVSRLWFDDQFGFAFALAISKSGGVLVIWNHVNFVMEELGVATRFISMVGFWVIEQWWCGIWECMVRAWYPTKFNCGRRLVSASVVSYSLVYRRQF
ncbi:hypothetical protein V6N13_013173 [Hibiscus sabdariffa]